MKIDDLATQVDIVKIIHDVGLHPDGRFTLAIMGQAPLSILDALRSRFLAQQEITATVFRDEWQDPQGWRLEWGTGIQIAGYLTSLGRVLSHNFGEVAGVEFVASHPPVFTRLGGVTTIQGPRMEAPPIK